MKVLKLSARNSTIDNIKAVGIILVIMGHVSQEAFLSRWIYSFHMPLFFFISGVCFLFSRKDNFIFRKVKSILVPYFCFGVASLLYWAFWEAKFREIPITTDIIKGQMFNLLGILMHRGGVNDYLFNVVLWFLPCLFVVEILLFTTEKVVKSRCCIGAVIITAAVISWIYNRYISYPLFFRVDVAVTVMPFALIGVLINEKFIAFCNRKSYVLDGVLFVFSLGLSIILCHWISRLDLNVQRYPSPYFILYFQAMVGILLVTIISKYIKWGFIEYIGRNSLIIMCIHEPIKRIVIAMMSKIAGIDIAVARTEYWSIFMITAITLLSTLPIVFIINKYMPFMLGKVSLKTKS